jgi:hypothetical protein
MRNCNPSRERATRIEGGVVRVIESEKGEVFSGVEKQKSSLKQGSRAHGFGGRDGPPSRQAKPERVLLTNK